MKLHSFLKRQQRESVSLLLILTWIWPGLCLAQASGQYQIGFAKRSIEPTTAQVSVSLAGYGLPAEGRFSLSWEEVSSPDISSSVDRKVRKQIQASGRIFKEYQRYGKLFFAIDHQDQLWKGADRNGGHISWEKLAVFKGAKSLAFLGRKIFISDEDNKIWKVDFSDEIFRKPVQIGRINGFTHKIEIQKLHSIKGRLFALSTDRKWYRAAHQTENSLSARAFAVQQGKDKMVFLTLDLCGFDYSFAEEVKKQISRKHRLEPRSIFINASHTHFAPVSQAWTTWAPFYQEPDSSYLNDVVKKSILEVVDAAFSNKKAGNLLFGRGETNIGINRNKERNEGPVDRTLDVIKVVDKKQSPIGVIFLTGVHPVFNNKNAESYTLSANYPGVARHVIEEETGVEQTMFIQGCAGDINPASASYHTTGKDLAADVIKILKGQMTPITGRLNSFMDSVSLPVKPMSLEELNAFRIKNMEAPATVYTEKNLRWVSLMERRHQEGTLKYSIPVYFQTMNLGSWKLFGLSREAVTSYGMRIREIWPDQTVSVAGYSNDVSSYLPDAWHIESKVYEGYESFFWYGQEGIPGPDIQEQILRAIKKKNQ